MLMRETTSSSVRDEWANKSCWVVRRDGQEGVRDEEAKRKRVASILNFRKARRVSSG